MNHDVLWDVAAYRLLTTIWHSANDREPIAYALDRIHESLSTAAADQGESRDLGLRVLFVPPLGIQFWARSDE